MRGFALASLVALSVTASGCLLLYREPEGSGGAGGVVNVTTADSTAETTTASGPTSGSTSASTTSDTGVAVSSSSSSGGCTNTLTDRKNCGMCGHECPELTDGCSNGVCDHNVFVTSVGNLDGALGGTAGADATCQNLATVAGLYGSYAAWVSVGVDDVASRLGTTKTDGGRIVNHGKIIAANFAALATGDLQNPIEIDESGNLVTTAKQAITNTDTSGHTVKAAATDACTGFTKSMGLSCAGLLVNTAQNWTDLHCSWACVSKVYHLYCIEK